MFPLYQKELPASGDDLAAALEASLRRLVVASGRIVSIVENAYPDLAEIAINLDDAQLKVNAPRPSLAADDSATAISVDRLTLTGRQLSVGGASLGLDLNAQHIVLRQGRDKNGDVLLLLHRATDGQLALSIQEKDLEAMIGEIAKTGARKQGVNIEDVRLTLTPHGSRSIGCEVQLQARKLFVRAMIRIAARLEIDDQLVARIFDLTCTGEGAIANLACSVLAPHLRKLSERNFELMALPLGEVQLRNVRIEAAGTIKISAEFGSANDRQPG
jgi:hypothetical protein